MGNLPAILTSRSILSRGHFYLFIKGTLSLVFNRYVGIDLGKRTYEVAIVGKGGKIKKSNGKTHAAGRQALYNKLRSGDKVALEACNLAFTMAKEIEAALDGIHVYVLNPFRLAIIYASMMKTDKEDSLKLAHILVSVNLSGENGTCQIFCVIDKIS